MVEEASATGAAWPGKQTAELSLPSELQLTVVYLRPGFLFERRIVLTAPATVGEAIEASGLLVEVDELRGRPLEVGVFSQRRALTDPLHDGDRVEVYRPLTIDPKEARRIRGQVQRRRRAARRKPGA